VLVAGVPFARAALRRGVADALHPIVIAAEVLHQEEGVNGIGEFLFADVRNAQRNQPAAQPGGARRHTRVFGRRKIGVQFGVPLLCLGADRDSISLHGRVNHSSAKSCC